MSDEGTESKEVVKEVEKFLEREKPEADAKIWGEERMME